MPPRAHWACARGGALPWRDCAPEQTAQSLAGRRPVAGTRLASSRSGKTPQAADGAAHIMSRHAGGDAMFGSLFRDIGQKAGRTGWVGI